MRIAVVGGGPGGLYFSILMRKVAPDCQVTVFERNRATDAFGFGVVFSDETLTVFEHADPESYAAITERFARWTDIDIHHRGTVHHLGRPRVLRAGPARAARRSSRSARCRSAPRCASSPRRRRWPSWTGPTWSSAPTAPPARSAARSHARLRALARAPPLPVHVARHRPRVRRVQVLHRRDPVHGVFQAHAYPYDESMSTFIVETHEDVWRRAGLDSLAPRSAGAGGERHRQRRVLRGAVRRRARRPPAARQQLQVDQLRHGPQPPLVHRQRRAARRRRAHRALLDRLGHEAGHGGRGGAGLGVPGLAATTCRAAPAAYEAERRPMVESTQRAAQASLEWFEGIGRYVEQERPQFAFNLLTRSRRVTYENLRLRDPEFVAEVDEASHGRATGCTRGRRCSRRSSCARWCCPTGSSSRRWTCTRRSTARPATSISCTWAPARSAAPAS